MTRTPLAPLPLLALGLVAAGAALRPAPRVTPAPLVMTGRDSGVPLPGVELARTQAQLDRLWIDHAGERLERTAQGAPITPRIDFDAYCALMIFGGESVNANGYRVLEVIDAPADITVRYERASYQTASLEGVDLGDPVRPWALILIPANDKPVLVERNTQGMQDPAPVWTREQTFPAP